MEVKGLFWGQKFLEMLRSRNVSPELMPKLGVAAEFAPLHLAPSRVP